MGFNEDIRAFYEAHRQTLFTYALTLTRDAEAAEDVVHTVFCRLLNRGKAPRELRPYVFRAVRNGALDLAQRNNHELDGQSIFARHGDSPHPEVQLEVEEALGTLGREERECIVLKFYNGVTFKEIAKVMRVSINTAASWYRRGLEKMRSTLEESSDERR